MKDFEEIAHTGGKITFFNDGLTRFDHNKPHAITMYEIAISLNGLVLGRTAFGYQQVGLPKPYLTVMMASDKEGFSGYSCPSCKNYFRGKLLPEYIYCPYCLHYENALAFLTENQQKYIQLYFVKLIEYYETKKEIVIDLDDIIKGLDNNFVNLHAYETKQQRLIVCEECNAQFDVLGDYASCPKCAHRNNFFMFNEYIREVFQKLKDPNTDCNDLLNRLIEHFVGIGNDIKKILLKLIPLTSSREKLARKIDFQKVINANDCLIKIFDLRLFSDSEDLKQQYLLIFQKRHIIAHNGAIVDEKYIQETGDSSVKLGQKIKLQADELTIFLKLLQKETKNFFMDFEELFKDWCQKYRH